MKLKSILLTGLSFVLVTAVAIGGTMAYLTSQDEDVNVMTMGNVKIEQHEYQRVVNADGTYATATIDNQTSYILEEFKQAKPLLPIVGDPSKSGSAYAGWDSTIVRMTQVDSYGHMQVFAGKNAQDKFVTVENTGKSDAYVRTLVAIECGTGNANLIGTSTRCVKADEASTSTAPWVSNYIGKIAVDTNTYLLYEYIYRGASDVNRHVNGVLPAGDTSYPNLAQVYLKSETTNEDCEALDGNGNGTLDILVLSQAVQADGFANAETALDTAFGDITTTSHPWIDGVEIPTVPFVTTADELKEALENGESVSLATDVALTETFDIPAGKNATINLCGNELSFVSTESKASCAIANKGTLTLKNGTVTYKGVGDPSFGYGTNTINNSGKLVIDGVTVINTTNSGSSVAIDCSAGAELVVNSGKIVSEKNAIRLCPFGSAAINCTINGGSITGARAIQIQLPSNQPSVAPDVNLTINGGTLTGNSGLALYSYSAGQSFADVNVIINGGIFNGDVCFGGGNAKTTKETVTITGGTFNGKLGRYVTDDGTNDGWEAIAKP